MKRRIFCAAALAVLTLSSFSQASSPEPLTFHFYGAGDCPPCMVFKKRHLAEVQAAGAAQGFAVEVNVIPKTRDVPTLGVYGDRDAVLRKAARQLDVVYPPIFFVSKGEEIVSVHGHDWSAALAGARKLAGQVE